MNGRFTPAKLRIIALDARQDSSGAMHAVGTGRLNQSVIRDICWLKFLKSHPLGQTESSWGEYPRRSCGSPGMLFLLHKTCILPLDPVKVSALAAAEFLSIYFAILFSAMFRASLRLFQVTKITTGISGLHGIPVL